jgi:hypothetical protein
MPLTGARMAAYVKGFGCQPHRAAPRALAAGVRKPPGEETAMGERVAVPQSLDLIAAGGGLE